MAAILAQRALHKSVNLHMHAFVCLCVCAQMHPYTISEHCLITASLLHENLLANSMQFTEREKLVGEQRNLS